MNVPGASPSAASVRGHGVVLRTGPEKAWHALIRILCYSWNGRDCTINGITLVVICTALTIATVTGSLDLGSFFWLPVTVLVTALQCIEAILTRNEGFSLIWCCLAGLMLYEEARWHALSAAGWSATAVSALAAACACAFALVYYLLEELIWEAPSDLSRLHGLRWALAKLWDRLGTTGMHTGSMGVGAALGALADVSPGRAATFWGFSILALVAVLVAVPLVMRHHRRLRSGCGIGSVAPDAPTMTAEELALASLQRQLLRTRDEMRYIRSRGDLLLDQGQPAAADGYKPESLVALERRESQLTERIEQHRHSTSRGGTASVSVKMTVKA